MPKARRYGWSLKVNLPTSWRRKLRHRARRNGTTVSAQIRLAVGTYLLAMDQLDENLQDDLERVASGS